MFLLPWHYTTIFFVMDSMIIFTAQIVHSHIIEERYTLSHIKTYTVYKKCSQQIITQKQLESYYLTEGSPWELYNSCLLTVPCSRRQQRFVWCTTDTPTITTSTSQLIVTSVHYTAIAKTLDCKEYLVTILLKWPGFCHSVNVCFSKKCQLWKVWWCRFFCTWNRWWLSPGPYLQKSHAPCSLQTACLVFLHNWTSKIILNSTQLRKRPPFSAVGNNEAQVYAKGNFSIWKSRVQRAFHNK